MKAVILAGGKSRRMGEDKAFMQWNGISFIDHIIQKLQTLGFSVALSGDAPRLRNLGFPVIEDEIPGNGPMGALASIFTQIKESVLILSCDVPQIEISEISRLWKESHLSTNAIVAFSFQGKINPLVAVYKPEVAPILKEALKNDELRIMSIFDKVRTTTMEYKGEVGLHNLNTKKDVAQWLTH